MAWNPVVDLERLQGALKRFDKTAVQSFCEELLARVFGSAEPYPALAGTKLLTLLRKRRFFECMQRLADAFIQTGAAQGNDGLALRRLYAQALLDQGHFTAAQQTLDKLVADAQRVSAKESAEAQGLVGRLYKQMYINARAPGVPRNRDWLARAAAAYFGPYREAPLEHTWHGINVVAVAQRSLRDNVPLAVPGIPLPLALAQTILQQIEAKDATLDAKQWDFGTAAEACLALGEPEAALRWAGRYADDAGSDTFEFAGTLRQLEEVWQLPRPGTAESMRAEEAILSLLRAKVLEREGGSVVADGAAVRAELGDLRVTDLQKVFGAERFLSLDWYRRGLARCAGVARIGREASKGVGTGFLVRGNSLHASLGDELYLLTNAHVVSLTPEVPIAITPDEAVVTFEGLTGAEGQSWHFTETIYSSPIAEFDATLLRLDRPVPLLDAYPIAKRQPPLENKERIYVVGHPLGGGLSFSMQDNLLLDHDERRVHYRTPTEPGSSGSPVFNSQWELIALHHAGRSDMRMLNGKDGSYEANEGISIMAIRDGLARKLGAAAASVPS